ncbi:MAG: AMP-binding protein, partial [Treponema sp.]|nr:AMP-binding protein [Treponema sp.]
MYRTVLEAVLSHAETTPGKTAIVDNEKQLSYQELASALRAVAFRLREAGIKKEERVLVPALPSAMYVITYLALHHIGAIAVPVAKDAARDSVEWMKTTFQAVDTPALPEVSRLIAET